MLQLFLEKFVGLLLFLEGFLELGIPHLKGLSLLSLAFPGRLGSAAVP